MNSHTESASPPERHSRALRLTVEYDGCGFAGWADQPDQRTVEGVLTDALATLVRHPVKLTVAGRTDAGVHATGQVASVVVDTVLSAEKIRRGLAALLPHDVAARRVEDAPDGFDARVDADARRYEYRLLLGPDAPLRRRVVHPVRRPVDVAAMQQAAGFLVGRHDFTAFTPTRTEHVFFQRTVTECRCEIRADELVIVVEANAFLRGMVRTIAGTLLDVGLGRRTPDDVAALLRGAPRAAAGPTLPARALTLVEVRYGRERGGRREALTGKGGTGDAHSGHKR